MLFSCRNVQTPVGEIVKIGSSEFSRPRRLFQIASRVFAGSIALSILTFIAFRLGFTIAATSAAYMLVVVLESLSGDFAASVVVSLVAFGLLDFFFTEPRFSFVVADPLDFLDLMAFIIVALVVTRLVSRLRVEIRSTKLERLRTERLFKLAQELLLLEPRAAVDATCLEPFRKVFGIRAVSLFDNETGQLHSAGESRASLGTRTRGACFTEKDADDYLERVATRCLR